MRFGRRHQKKDKLFSGFKSPEEIRKLDRTISQREKIEGQKADQDLESAWDELENKNQ